MPIKTDRVYVATCAVRNDLLTEDVWTLSNDLFSREISHTVYTILCRLANCSIDFLSVGGSTVSRLLATYWMGQRVEIIGVLNGQSEEIGAWFSGYANCLLLVQNYKPHSSCISVSDVFFFQMPDAALEIPVKYSVHVLGVISFYDTLIPPKSHYH